MRTHFKREHSSEQAISLILALVLAALSFLVYAVAVRWTSTSSTLNDRNNVFNSAQAAAEGATEQVLAFMARDFQAQTFDPNVTNIYTTLIPTNNWASSYQFSDNHGGVNQTWIGGDGLWITTNLTTQFAGLYGFAYTYNITSSAKPVGGLYKMAASVEQDLQLASIPVFQFAIFSGLDLEINPGPNMKVTGKVHSNANLYTCPGATLEYCDSVTAVGRIYNNRAAGDPQSCGGISPIYDGEHVDHVGSLTLPLGTNAMGLGVSAILQVPPFGEDPHSAMGQQRLYNQVDLILTVTDTNAVLTTGLWNSLALVPPDVAVGTNPPSLYSFIQTNASFYDQREGKSTFVTDINVGAFKNWLTATGASLALLAKNQIGHYPNSIFANDLRQAPGKLAVVRVINGQTLPLSGLTVASPRPMYVQGNYNAPDLTPGSTNTSNARAAALMGDAITVLSSAWSDANNANSSQSMRAAANTTVNAAFLAGIVPTTNVFGVGHYSGGVENFSRFLENWSGTTFTYNGSMVLMFASQYATGYWVTTGVYYNPPTRSWAFDSNYLNYQKLPPVTPQARKVVRGQWQLVAAH